MPKQKVMRCGTNPNKARSTSFKDGHKKNGGRPKGRLNKTTAVLKDAVLMAATLVGQDGRGRDGLVGYLKMLAVKERVVYVRLLEKVLPLQIAISERKPTYTPAEAVQKMREKGLPIPPSLLSLAGGTDTIIDMPIADDAYDDELNGIDHTDEDEPLDDIEHSHA